MNIWPQIRKNLKQMVKQEYYIIATFILFPIIVALIFGMMNRRSFEGKVEMKPVKVQVDYDKTHHMGEILTNDFKNEDIKALIEVTDQDAECQVILDKDYKCFKIVNLNTTDDRIAIVKRFFKNVVSNVTEYDAAEAYIKKSSLSDKVQEELKEELQIIIGDIQGKESVKERIVDGYKTLNSYEYYTLSIFSFTSMLLIIMFVNKLIDEDEAGIIKRSLTTMQRKREYLLGYLLSIFGMALIVNGGYIFIMRLCKMGFKAAIAAILIILVVQSILQASMALCFALFIKNKIAASSIVSVILLVPAIASGVFTNIDLVKSDLSKWIAHVVPNTLILNAYKSLEIGNGLKEVKGYIIGMLILSFILLGIGVVRVKVKEEV